MERTKAVKMIMQIQESGLVKAIDTYNYLSCYGEIKVSTEMIRDYFTR